MTRSPLFIFLAMILISMFVPSCMRYEENIPEPKPSPGNVLHIDVPTPLVGFSPFNEEAGSCFVFPFLHGYLFLPDEYGELRPMLAASWSYDFRNLTWAINLRKDVRFHNGKTVIGDDVVYSMQERLRNVRPQLYQVIEKINSLSDVVIHIILKKDDPDFLSKVWDTEIVPRPTDSTEDHKEHPIGSGPFKFKSRDGEEKVELTANDYFYKGRPSLDGVVIHYEADSEKSWARLINGTTDIAFRICPNDYNVLEKHKELFYLNSHILLYYTILLYNIYNPIFDDPNVRLALALAIDKEAIIKEVFKGFAKISSGPVSHVSSIHSGNIEPTPYNPEKALKLLLEAGWSYDERSKYLKKDGRYFEFSILTFSRDMIMRRVADYLQLYFNDIGIMAHLSSLPIDEAQKRYIRNTEFQAVLTELRSCIQTPEALMDLWSSIGPGKSAAGCFEDPRLTRVLAEAVNESDPEKKQELIGKAEAIIVSLQPGTFLFHRMSLDVMSRRIHFPYPFSIKYEDLCRLPYASIQPR